MPPSNERYPRNSSEPDPAAPVPFRHKGIGANMFLTAAAALVPLVILGVSAYTTVLGQKGSSGGKRSAPK